jgi:hypothetical protein
LKAVDHVLVCDNVYRPTRSFCDAPAVAHRHGALVIDHNTWATRLFNAA